MVPHVSEMVPVNKADIPGNPAPNTRWRWIKKGLPARDGHRITLACWYVGSRPYTTNAAVREFLERCTAERSGPAVMSDDVIDAELAACGLV